EKIKELNSLIHKMTHKGQILISQAKMFTAENSRLEQLNQELQDTLRHLEQHLAKTIGENNLARKNYLKIIKEMRNENQNLVTQISQLEGLIKQYSQKQKFDQMLAQNSKITPGDKNLRNIENSSLLVQKLLDENS